MIELIETMIRIKKDNEKAGKKDLVFPHRILDTPEDYISWPSETFDLQKLYPNHPVFSRRDITEMQAELEASLGTIDLLKNQVHILTNRLHKIPGYKMVKKIGRMLKK